MKEELRNRFKIASATAKNLPASILEDPLHGPFIMTALITTLFEVIEDQQKQLDELLRKGESNVDTNLSS